jgi:hypothetical protein
MNNYSYVPGAGHKTPLIKLANNPDKISLNSFTDGIVEILLKFANDNNKELKLMQFEVKETNVRSDNIPRHQEGSDQIGLSSYDENYNYCTFDNGQTFTMKDYLDQEVQLPSIQNSVSLETCRIGSMINHPNNAYTDPDLVNNGNNTAIQLLIKQNGIETKVGNCGVATWGSSDYANSIQCMNNYSYVPGAGHKTPLIKLANNPDKISLNNFTDGIVEILLRLPRPGGSKTDVNDFEELRIMKFEIYIEPVPGCRSPFASNYNGNAIPPKEGEEDVTCEIPLNINHIKLEE